MPQPHVVPSPALGELRDLVERLSLRRGDFTLASGEKSSFYFDIKATVLSPRGARLIGESLFACLADTGVEAAGGLAMGATYLAAAVAIVSDERGRPIHGFTVRSRGKDHGLEQTIDEAAHPDGRPLLCPGRHVAVLEDVVTRGGSVLKAIEAVQARGCEIEAVVSIVDRNAGGGDMLRERGLPYFSLLETDADGNLTIARR